MQFFFPFETICIKYQILFPGKYMKNVLDCYLLIILPEVLSTEILYSNISGLRYFGLYYC